MHFETVVLHLSLISGVGSVTIQTILNHVVASKIDELYGYKVADFMKFGITSARAQALVDGLADKSLLDSQLQLIDKHKIHWVSVLSDDYPQLLKHIECPPAILYYQGANLFDHKKMLSFVGARKADGYARVVLDRLIPPLVHNNWTIVSGGAIGTDSLAHQKTLQSGGKTVVVLGSGLLHWYPFINSKMFQEVIDAGGMIVSSFPLQTKPNPGNFPVRNRIISGLSVGTVVVQAAEKSGTLITAHFALEQGREVFAVPGSIESDMHVGCHRLIQQGAKLILSADDIVQELGYDERIEHLIDQEELLSDDQILLNHMHNPVSTDVLLGKVDMSLDKLNNKLFDLSLEGKIEQDMMGLWKRI